MRSFPEKPQRNEEQHATMRTAEGNDTLGMELSIILRTLSRDLILASDSNVQRSRHVLNFS